MAGCFGNHWVDRCLEQQLFQHLREEDEREDTPEDCKAEYDENICTKCSFLTSEKVTHPGGDSKILVDKNSCMLNYWEDNF